MERVGKQEEGQSRIEMLKLNNQQLKETIQDLKYSISHDPKVVLHSPSRQKHLTLQTTQAHGPLHIVALTTSEWAS